VTSVCVVGWLVGRYRPYGREVDYEFYFRGFEQIMHSLGGRPHWAKAFGLTSQQLRALYGDERWNKFLAVREQVDPHKLFDNAYLRRVFDDTPASKPKPAAAAPIRSAL
jgi:L-gulonolactone oxidase